jgi:hypothetical protein
VAIVAVVVVVGGGLALLLSGGGGTTTIGPKTVNVAGTQPWTATGIVLKAGDDVSITATGTVFPAVPDRTMAANPDGVPNRPDARQFNVVAGVDHSGLIGRIGDAGSPFVVGGSDRFKPSTAGALFLGVNDTGVNNNDGTFVAHVTVTRK